MKNILITIVQIWLIFNAGNIFVGMVDGRVNPIIAMTVATGLTTVAYYIGFHKNEQE